MKSDHQNIKLINPKMAEMIPPMSKDICKPPADMKKLIKNDRLHFSHFFLSRKECVGKLEIDDY